jgi:sugar phosphate isomerase/epimerase
MTVTMHAPFTELNPAWPFEPVRSAVARTLREFIDLSSYLDAKIVTFHPGSVNSEVLVPQAIESSTEMMRSLAKECGHGIALSIENQAKSRSGYHFPVGSTVESMEVLLAQIEGSRFTMDTGHANLTGVDLQGLSNRFNRELIEIHLHDNKGLHDDHLIPGEGSANLRQLLHAISDKDVVVCLELDPFRYSQNQVLEAHSALFDKLKT